MNRRLLIISIILTILVLLVLPLIHNKKISLRDVVGPDVSELEYTEVYFENAHAGFQLSGMLFLPEGDGPFPTAVIIHGSGTSRRNNRVYISIAEYLQANGIAVLLPDKRGCEKSEGDWIGASIEELATDSLSAVEFVKTQELFSYSTIGLLGMSQGGWIAPVAASISDELAFVISMSGGAVTTDEQYFYEVSSDFEQYTYKFIARLITAIYTPFAKQSERLSALYPFDPIPYWKEVHLPVFFAFGEKDPFTPVEESANRLREYNLDQFQIKVYPDGQHAILGAQSNELSEEYLNDLLLFINDAS